MSPPQHFQIFLDPEIAPEKLSANPELVGLTSLQLLDATVEALTEAGLIVLPNNHMSTAMWCCSMEDGEGLWYTDEYPEQRWLEGWRLIAERYKVNRPPPHRQSYIQNNSES